MAYYKCGRIYTTQNSNVVVDTASGAIANFETPLAMPLLKTRFDFKATQDLHGQSGPYPAGGSAQIWDEEWEVGTIATGDGQNSSSTTKIRSVGYINVEPDTTYMYASDYGCNLFFYGENYSYISYASLSANKTFTTPNTCKYIRFTPVTNYGAVYKNDISINYPATDTAYHPYSNICPIEGVSAVNVTKCGLNLADIKPIEDWELSGAYYLLFNSVPNKQVQMCFIDNDTSVDVSDINIGFVDSNYDKVHALTPRQYRWCLTSGGIQTNRTNLSAQGNNILTGLMIYPKSEEVFNRLFARYKIVISVNNETTYEPYNGSTILINLGGTYYGGYVSQDKDGKRELVVTHGYASYDLSQIPPNQTADGWDSWLIYRAERAENNPSSSVGKLCNCCPEYSYAGGQINRPHYYVSAGAFVMYLAENTYRDGFLEYTYPLETPFTVALPDGEPIKSLPGVNNIYADTGDTSLQFTKIGN